ncbi:MAG: efflux RND transporter periplasmic adaptor subunit [Pseudomonadota bacterium]
MLFKPRVYSLFILAPLLVACGAEEVVEQEPLTRPVKVFVVESASANSIRTFPGTVDADQSAELAFRVGGLVQDILVREGDMVEPGQVLARLDPTDYKLVEEDRQATFDNAKANFDRAQELVADGNISRMDFDTMEANFRTASAALSQAQKDLEYTILSSPFRGLIAQRQVEKFEEVIAKQAIIVLQDITKLEVIINVPESVVRMVAHEGPINSGNVRDDEEMRKVVAVASFEGQTGQTFSLTPKEVATKADPQTQTFRATFSMDAPTSFTLLPGMTATVTLDFTRVLGEQKSKWVPVRAVQADEALAPRVWLLNPDDMTVSSRDVEIGRLSGGSIEILDGLSGGDEIVAVGAPYLAEGMRVTRMALSEQAVPREDDPS